MKNASVFKHSKSIEIVFEFKVLNTTVFDENKKQQKRNALIF